MTTRYVGDRIYNRALRKVGDKLFDKSRFSGGEMARRLDLNHNTLWSWFFRRGITEEAAFKAADVLTEWAIELLEMAHELRRLEETRHDVPEVTEGVATRPRRQKVA
jgi:hypothetical protein